MKNGLEVDEYGAKSWYKDDLLHRDDGPAYEDCDGYKYWYQNGDLHRLGGPAVEYPNGYKEWWYQGKEIFCSSQKEFEKIIKLKVFL